MRRFFRCGADRIYILVLIRHIFNQTAIDVKSLFPEFYRLTEDELGEVWKNGLFVFDANALLSITAFGKEERTNALNAVRSLGDAAWIPHLVALEFTVNRDIRINGQKSAANIWLQGLKESLGKLARSLDTRKTQWGIEASAAAFSEVISGASIKLDELLAPAVSGFVNDIESSKEEVFREIEVLFRSRVGEAPKNQQELDSLVLDADKRIKNSVPPGYADAIKDESQTPLRTFGMMTYRRAHGDLIIWKQLLTHAKNSNKKSVSFITDDIRKGDWTDVTGGAKRELREEALAYGVERFQILSLERFLSGLAKYRAVEVEDTTLIAARESVTPEDSHRLTFRDPETNVIRRIPVTTLRSVINRWIREMTGLRSVPTSANLSYIKIRDKRVAVLVNYLSVFQTKTIDEFVENLEMSVNALDTDHIECFVVTLGKPDDDILRFLLSEAIEKIIERRLHLQLQINYGVVFKDRFYAFQTSLLFSDFHNKG